MESSREATTKEKGKEKEEESDRKESENVAEELKKSSEQHASAESEIGPRYERTDAILDAVRKKAEGSAAEGAISSQEAFSRSLSRSSSTESGPPPWGGDPSIFQRPAGDPGRYQPTSAAMESLEVEGVASPGFRERCLSRTSLLVCAAVPAAIVIVGGLGGIAYAIVANVQKSGKSGPSGAKPATPEGVAVTANGPEISLTWKSVPGATSYAILEGDKTLATINDALAGGKIFQEPNAGVRHCYRVVATNAYGSSDPSAEVCVTTGPTAKPGVPQLTAVEGTELDKIKITWPPVAGAERYGLRRRLSGAGSLWGEIITISAASGSNSHVDSGLTANTGYCYSVRAENALGASEFGAEMCGQTLNSFDILNRQIVESWNAMSEERFWGVLKDWLKVEQPSFPVQLYAMTVLYKIADKTASPVLTEEAARAKAEAFAQSYTESPDTLALYDNCAALVSRETQQPAARHEKINVLMRAIGLILNPPAPPAPPRQ